MELPVVFESSQLAHIIEQAMICMCACPAQVAQEILSLRELYQYQLDCTTLRKEDLGVHERIMQSLLVVHAEMEKCLDDVLVAEGWDKETLAMPEGLRQLRDDMVG